MRLVLHGLVLARGGLQLPPLGLQTAQAKASIDSVMYQQAVNSVRQELEHNRVDSTKVKCIIHELQGDAVMVQASVSTSQSRRKCPAYNS